MKKVWTQLVIGVCLAGFLAGCGGTESQTEETRVSESEKSGPEDESTEYGDEIHVAMAAVPDSMDVHYQSDQLARIIGYGMIWESLMTMTEDYIPKPELAESCEVNEDCTEYVYNLRKGVLFHDGQEMKADDVVASMNRWISAYGSVREMVGESRFEKVDDYTVKISMEKPALFLNELIAAQSQCSAIMPETVIENVDESTGFINQYIGTGPYKFEEWADGQYIKLTRNEEYQPYGNPGEASGWWGYKNAYIKDVYFDFVPDNITRGTGVLTGEYDFGFQLPSDNYSMFDGNPDTIIYKENAGSAMTIFNKKEGLSVNPLIRKAVLYAVDPENVMQAAWTSTDFYRMESSYMSQEQANWYSKSGSEYYDAVDKEKAKQYLEEAGYNGEVYRILVNSDHNFFTSMAVVIKAELEEIGMNVELKSVEAATFLNQRNDSSIYDAFLATPIPVCVPSMQIYLNPSWPGWTTDEKIMELNGNINSSLSVEEAKGYWDELQEYCWAESLPVIKYGEFFNYSVSSSKVKDLVYFNGPYVGNAKIEK
ncbi:MAG TPA: hypothetical protein IAA07_10945 [Candidatus Lachnoclostridium stercoravium]|uniref:Solute-binding protein family 5 domain-containing protein n=1 Tax=Candidatus Lachnoclostridium stercoravium TaxID=2838633 RepID=A0A9D2KPD2_9FIRM|nr:hypothetical protein [Candidatus Lachnoclostridium stercoravium]